MSIGVLDIEKRKMLVPQLRFQEFDGRFTNNLYRRHSFKDIFVFATGKNIKQNEALPEFEIPCVRYGELYHMYNEVIYKVINRTNLDKSELLFSKGDEILLPSAGEDPSDIGSASALMIENVAIGRTINILRPLKQNVYSQIYVSYYINEKLKKEISKLAKGSSISNVYNSDLKTLEIILPSLPEQQKIASFLCAVDEKIQQLSREKELLEQYKKGIMQQLFSGKLRFKKENGDDYPDWEENKLGELCEIKGRIGYRGYTVQDIVEKGKGAITLSPSNMKKGKLNYDNSTYISWFKYEESPEIKVEMNDVLLVKTASVGKSAFVGHLPEPATINPQIVILKRTTLFPKYLGYVVYHSTIQKQITEAVGAGVVPNLSQASISNFLVPCPSNEEQQKIANFLSSIDTKIENVNQKIGQTQTFKKGLLQQMFI